MSGFTLFTGTVLVVVFLGGTAGLGIATEAVKRRETRSATRFGAYVLSVSAWMFATGFLWISSTRAAALFFDTLIRLVSIPALLAWVLFVVAYTDRRDHFSGWRRGAVLGWAAVVLGRGVLTPVLGPVYADVAVIEYQGLTLLTTESSAFLDFFVLPVAFIVLSWSFVLLGQFYRSAVAGQRRQAGHILLAALLPATAIFGYHLGDLSITNHLDPTPLCFVVTVVGTWFALFEHDFLDVEPVTARTLFETMDDPVIIVDGEGTVLNVNDAAAELQFSPGDEVPASLARSLESEQGEFQLITAEGDQRVFDLRGSSIEARGSRTKRLVVLRDITLRTRRERELKRQNERLDEFASVASHDLRNPLNVAQGNLDVLEDTGDTDRIEVIRRSLTRMEEIIEDLLTLARAGEDIDATTSVRVGAVAREAWDQIPAAADVRVEVDADARVDADRSRLGQLFENLFRNAIEHNDPPLTITVETTTTADGTITVAVSDDGSGIPEGDRETVFEHGHTTKDDGTGLGLSIVDGIAAAHGWDIRVTDSETGGARFEIPTG